MKADKNIIDRIKEEKVRQKPRWYFKSLMAFRWICYVLCLLIGAASFSVILFVIQQNDFNLLTHLRHSKLEFFLTLLPIFWLFTLFVFLLFSIVIVRTSRRGYKYHWRQLFVFNAVASMVLGTLFFMAGGAHQLEHAFAEKVSVYESVQQIKLRSWMQPEAGFLAGSIQSSNHNTLILVDFNNQVWQVDFTDAWISPMANLSKGNQIKLTGTVTGPKQFKVDEIRPWSGRMGHPGTSE